jgi:hypothetical protein
MQRGALLIGVSKTGGMPQLQAVESGLESVRLWAVNQGIKPEHLKVFSDAKAPVESSEIRKAVRDLVALRSLDQLVIYFAGHGVNIGYSEYWLLSGAPDDASEAINVDGSLVLARQCRIPHIVILSDACRTAADGIQQQRIAGSLLFPNLREGGLDQPVDIFFATSLGRPALELKDPHLAADGYTAAYTTEVAKPLKGEVPELLEPQQIGRDSVLVLRPWPLKKYIGDAIRKRMAAAHVDFDQWAPPDARISSPPDAWVAIHSAPIAPAQPTPAARGAAWRSANVVAENLPETIQSASQNLLRTALSDATPKGLARGAPVTAAPVVITPPSLQTSIARVTVPFGPTHFETGCGFKMQGATFADAFSATSKVDIGDLRDIVRIDIAKPANVLLTFDNGNGVVLPAIPGHLASLTYADDELVNVSYELSDNHSTVALADTPAEQGQLRDLRAIVAASARFGTFRLDRNDALQLANRMRAMKAIDLSMALYAAYVFNDLNRRDILEDMQNFVQRDMKLCLFDVALLGHTLDGTTVGSTRGVFPFLPLLSQGWALLPAYEIRMVPSVQDIRGDLVPSLWTLYNKRGVAKLRAAMQSQEIR